MRLMVCAVVGLFLAGCGAKPVLVKSGATTYTFLERGAAHDKEGGSPSDKAIDTAFTVPQYLLMFRSASAIEPQKAVKGSELDSYHAQAAFLGGVMATTPVAGAAFDSFSVVNLGFNLLAASQQQAYIKLSVNGYYQAVTNGSITIARWLPGAKPHEAAAQEFDEIKETLQVHCGHSSRPSRFNKFADRAARIDGKCEKKGHFAAVWADASARYSNFHQVMGDGSIVTFYFPASHWNEQERKELARNLRETLPAGWYVMRAMPVEDPATGQMEPRYMISMGGQHKAFPLPPKPVFE